MDDVGTALKADQRVDAAAGAMVFVRFGDVEQVLLRQIHPNVDARIRRLQRRDAGERPARAAAALAHIQRSLELAVRDAFRQRCGADGERLRCGRRNARHPLEARHEGIERLDQRRRRHTGQGAG